MERYKSDNSMRRQYYFPAAGVHVYEISGALPDISCRVSAQAISVMRSRDPSRVGELPATLNNSDSLRTSAHLSTLHSLLAYTVTNW
jgi:hypothetical protein